MGSNREDSSGGRLPSAIASRAVDDRSLSYLALRYPAIQGRFDNPVDTLLSASTRFAVEVIAWVAGPWAASEVSVWLIAPTAIVLIGLPSVFSTTGDKRHVYVATPGPARVTIEWLLAAVAIGAPWLIWPERLAAVAGGVTLLALAAGIPRMRWLLKGRQPPSNFPSIVWTQSYCWMTQLYSLDTPRRTG